MENDSNNITSIHTSDVCPKHEHDKRCAPGTRFDAGSCIKVSILCEMANAYNEGAGDDKIKLSRSLEVLNPRKYKKYLLAEFNKRMGEKCTTQKCWTEQKFIQKMKKQSREELNKYTFRPDGPKGKFEWLNTLNIKDTMEQYEKKYPEFKFLGAVPIDFNEFDEFKIRNLNYDELMKNGKHKFGVVFNLDEHDEPGSHWVAMYSDFNKGEVLFFDSYGTKPEKRIRKLMRKHADFIQNKLNKNINRVDYNDYNQVRHQYENSECGVYSINFILRMTRGDTFEDVCNSKISDKKINKCRNIYFGNTNV